MRVKYVVGAEFNLDGAQIRDVYPSDNHVFFNSSGTFSELLFPDLVRPREEDWSVGSLFRTADGFSYTPQSATAVKYYVYNIVRKEPAPKRHSRQGVHLFAVAIITPEPYFSVLQPLLGDAGRAYAQAPALSLLAQLHSAIHSVKVKSMPLFTHSEKRILQMNQQPSLFSDYYSPQSSAELPASNQPRPDAHYFDTTAQLFGNKYLLRIPTFMQNHNAGDFSLVDALHRLLQYRHVQGTHPELTPYGRDTPALLILWLAMLTRKRVIMFGGPQTSAAWLCDTVMAASFFGGAGGLLDTQRSTFPYVDLNRANDLLASKTFLAGVMNPVFINNPEWWDVAINLERPLVVISPLIATPVPPKPLLPRDGQFLIDLRNSLAASAPETEVRELVVEYTTDMLRSFAGEALARQAYQRGMESHMFVPGYGYYWIDDAERAQFEAVYSRVGKAWRVLSSFEYFMKMIETDVWPQQHKPVIDLKYHYDMLRHGQLDVASAASVYRLICDHVNDVLDITQFLAATNSIYYLVLGLYHPSPDVRDAVAQLVLRIQKHSAGQLYFLALPPFHSIGLHLAVKDRQVLDNRF